MGEAAVKTVQRGIGGHRRTSDILLPVAGFIVAGLGAAWFLSTGLAPDDPAVFEAPSSPAAATKGEATLAVSATAGDAADINLSKARMAASAGMLVEPAGQNALYFYSLVLDAEPERAEAAGELAAIADEVAGAVRAHLSAAEYNEAARLASRLAGVTPGHPVLVEFQETLIAEQQQLVMAAVGAAREGLDGQAAASLAAAEALPQVGGALVETAREQIGSIRAERAAAVREAERRRQAAARIAAAERAQAAKAEADQPAEPAPQKGSRELALARESLTAGRLIGPDDDNALAWLALAEAGSADAADVAEFRSSLITAVSVAVRDRIDAGELEDAEELLLQLEGVRESAAVAETLQQEVDRAFARRESARVIPANEMLATDITPPVYPRAAIRRGQVGWVEVEFTVLADGSTADAEVTDAAPEGVFDRASLRAVEEWRFKPRVYRGRPIDQRVSTRINFELEDG